MKKDSWYGKLLGHPESWCALIAGLVASIVLPIAGVIALTFGNYMVYQVFTTTDLDKLQVLANDKVVVTLFYAGILVDIFVVCGVIAGLLWCIAWVMKKLSGLCPKVNWE